MCGARRTGRGTVGVKPPAASPAPGRSTEAVPGRAPPGRLTRALFLALALASLGLAVLGLLLPGLPSTEFVLLAAWAAARSSPRLHAWLLRQRLFGPMIRHWQSGRVPRRAKWLASLAMAGAAAVLMASSQGAPGHGRLAALACMAVVLLWLWRRPEPEAEPGADPAGARGTDGL
jgi:uncharacterized protein